MRCTCGEENDASRRRCPRCGALLVAGFNAKRLFQDAIPGLGLVLALLLVLCFFPRGCGQMNRNAGVDFAEEGSARESRPLRLAVTPPEFDNVGRLLRSLGEGYRHQEIAMDELLDADKLSQFDVLFLTCGGVPRHWLAERTGNAERGSAGTFMARDDIARRLRDSLSRFVGRGGTLYASDWQYQLVATAFPSFVDDSKAGRGAAQTLRADVVDLGLKRQLGRDALELHFDKDAWRPAAFGGPNLITYLRGTYRTLEGREIQGPLLVEFPFEKGSVVFTSFHNEAQNSDLEKQLLRYLVFTTLTARTDAGIRRSLVRSGYAAVGRDLLSAASGKSAVAGTYACSDAKELQFVLGFASQGARFRLTVVGPDGQRFEKTGEKTFSVDIAPSARGDWQYTVTPVQLPYDNFPFTVTVGVRK